MGSGILLLGIFIGLVVDSGAVAMTLGAGCDWLVWSWKTSSVA